MCLVCEDGIVAGTHNDDKRLADAAREREERYGLVVVGGVSVGVVGSVSDRLDGPCEHLG